MLLDILILVVINTNRNNHFAVNICNTMIRIHQMYMTHVHHHADQSAASQLQPSTKPRAATITKGSTIREARPIVAYHLRSRQEAPCHRRLVTGAAP